MGKMKPMSYQPKQPGGLNKFGSFGEGMNKNNKYGVVIEPKGNLNQFGVVGLPNQYPDNSYPRN